MYLDTPLRPTRKYYAAITLDCESRHMAQRTLHVLLMGIVLTFPGWYLATANQKKGTMSNL